MLLSATCHSARRVTGPRPSARGDEQHDRGRRRDADRRGDGGLERVDAEETQQREHRRRTTARSRRGPSAAASGRGAPTRGRAGGRARRRSSPSENVGEARAICASALSLSQSEHAGSEQEAGGDVAGDRGQHARGGGEAAAEQRRRAAAARTAAKLLAAGGHAGRKVRRASSARGIARCREGRPASSWRRRARAGQGRIFSPDIASRLRSGLTRSSRETPSHMTSEAMTSADE